MRRQGLAKSTRTITRKAVLSAKQTKESALEHVLHWATETRFDLNPVTGMIQSSITPPQCPPIGKSTPMVYVNERGEVSRSFWGPFCRVREFRCSKIPLFDNHNKD